MDVRATPSRQARAVIYLNAAEIMAIMLQDDVLCAFTEEELSKIAFAVNAEVQSRQPQIERNDAATPA
jgi:hypothetical protein